jgi:DNA modification methylase
MPPVITGYFDDMYLALKEQFRVLKPGGFLVYMVANSRHSNLPIATDVLIGEIARSVGFEPLKLIVLHQRNGRATGRRFLRESVVIGRKPASR